MATKTVLLVDDDENTLIFTRVALKHMGESPQLQYVANGLQATQYLQGSGRFADRQAYPFPDLILLDLKMPVIDGFEFLGWIRSHPRFSRLPVVVLTGSTYPPDVRRAHQLGANSFLEKSSELFDFETALKQQLASFLQGKTSHHGGLSLPFPAAMF